MPHTCFKCGKKCRGYFVDKNGMNVSTCYTHNPDRIHTTQYNYVEVERFKREELEHLQFQLKQIRDTIPPLEKRIEQLTHELGTLRPLVDKDLTMRKPLPTNKDLKPLPTNKDLKRTKP